jgi:hypothetical protein
MMFLKAVAAGRRRYPVVTKDLQLYLDAYNLDSYSGSGSTWTDLSNSGYNMTIEGATWTVSGGRRYFDLDGVNDRIIGASNTALFDTNEEGWTWSMWVNHSAAPAYLDTLVGTTYYQDKVSYYMDNRISVPSNTGNGFAVGTYKGAPNNFDGIIRYAITVSTGVWRHVCGTLTRNSDTSGQMDIYLNGTNQGTSTFTVSGTTLGAANTSRKPVIGAFYDEATAAYSRYNAIRVGEVLQYDRPLTATEVSNNYEATKANYGL